MEEIKELVAAALEQKRVLSRLKAELRAQVFLAIDEQERSSGNEGLSDKTDNPHRQSLVKTTEGLLLAGLVREFLDWAGLEFTAKVYEPEMGQPQGMHWGRADLTRQLGLGAGEAPTDTPLLMAILRRAQGAPPPPAAPASPPGSVTSSASSPLASGLPPPVFMSPSRLAPLGGPKGTLAPLDPLRSSGSTLPPPPTSFGPGLASAQGPGSAGGANAPPMMIERTRQKRAISNESEDVGEVEEVEGKAGKEQGEGETGSEPSSPQSSVHEPHQAVSKPGTGLPPPVPRFDNLRSSLDAAEPDSPPAAPRGAPPAHIPVPAPSTTSAATGKPPTTSQSLEHSYADDIEVEEDHELEGAEILGGDDGEDEDYATAVFGVSKPSGVSSSGGGASAPAGAPRGLVVSRTGIDEAPSPTEPSPQGPGKSLESLNESGLSSSSFTPGRIRPGKGRLSGGGSGPLAVDAGLRAGSGGGGGGERSLDLSEDHSFGISHELAGLEPPSHSQGRRDMFGDTSGGLSFSGELPPHPDEPDNKSAGSPGSTSAGGAPPKTLSGKLEPLRPPVGKLSPLAPLGASGKLGDSGGLSVSDSLSSPGLGALGLGPPRPLAGPPAANPLGGRPPADDIKAELRRAGLLTIDSPAGPSADPSPGASGGGAHPAADTGNAGSKARLSDSGSSHGRSTGGASSKSSRHDLRQQQEADEERNSNASDSSDGGSGGHGQGSGAGAEDKSEEEEEGEENDGSQVSDIEISDMSGPLELPDDTPSSSPGSLDTPSPALAAMASAAAAAASSKPSLSGRLAPLAPLPGRAAAAAAASTEGSGSGRVGLSGNGGSGGGAAGGHTGLGGSHPPATGSGRLGSGGGSGGGASAPGAAGGSGSGGGGVRPLRGGVYDAEFSLNSQSMDLTNAEVVEESSGVIEEEDDAGHSSLGLDDDEPFPGLPGLQPASQSKEAGQNGSNAGAPNSTTGGPPGDGTSLASSGRLSGGGGPPGRGGAGSGRVGSSGGGARGLTSGLYASKGVSNVSMDMRDTGLSASDQSGDLDAVLEGADFAETAEWD